MIPAMLSIERCYILITEAMAPDNDKNPQKGCGACYEVLRGVTGRDNRQGRRG